MSTASVKIDGPAGKNYAAAEVEAYVAAIFARHGCSVQDAKICADALVRADLRGVWSHGVARVPMYVARLTAGVAKAQPAITVTKVTPAAASVDGDTGLGLVVARRAMDVAIELAVDAGVGCVGVKNSGHFGMGALYAEQAVDAGCLGMVFTNSSPALPPFGGRTAHLGTSPLAFGAPTGPGDPPFLIDMAMTTLARGKLKFAAQRGEPIPPGLALDAEGNPTTDGEKAFHGVVLPFGGVKGAALSWMMDIMGGVFTGAAFGGAVRNPFTDLRGPQDTGHLMLAMKADLFQPMQVYEARMSDGIAQAKALPKAAGFDEILTPGEPEARRQASNLAAGITLSDDVVQNLRDLGDPLALSWPDAP